MKPLFKLAGLIGFVLKRQWHHPGLTLLALLELGFTADKIITSLERKMTCGIGKCGRCNVGSKYVCKDGPVFTYSEIEKLPGPVP